MDVKETLIDLVEKAPPIWDKSHPYHHNSQYLSKQWKKIASKIGKPEAEVKLIWKNLRQQFGKQMRKYNPSGTAAPSDEEIPWAFYNQLQFLSDQFKARPASYNLIAKEENDDSEIPTVDEPSLTDEEDDRSSLESNTPKDQSVSEMSSSTAPKSAFRRRKTTQTMIGEALISLEKEKLELRKSKMQEQDDDMFFLRSILPQMKQLTPQQNMFFRIEVQRKLYELIYGTTEQTTETEDGAFAPI